MFADDIVNCFDTVVHLRNQLNITKQFCYETGMEINLDKTEIIVSKNSGPGEKKKNVVMNVLEYRHEYMDLYFTPNTVNVLSSSK